MTDRFSIGSPEQRRANRMAIERPVRLIAPVVVSGQTVNISANGMLVSVPRRTRVKVGMDVALALPHIASGEALTIKGRVVRVKTGRQQQQIAIYFDQGIE